MALIAAVTVAGCSVGSSNQAQAKTPARQEGIPVTAASVESRAVPIDVRAIGNVQAYTNVTIKVLVDGQVTQIAFHEGQEVKQGDLLFVIDPRPYQTALAQTQAKLAQDQAQAQQTQANLARDMAQLENARIEEKRYQDLVQKGYISSEQYDQVRTTAQAMQATVAADRAAIENAGAAVRADEAAVEKARLDLSYTKIYAPISGRTGNLLVHQGDIVKNNDTSLVVINQVHPIYVAFAVPEQVLPEIKQYMAHGALKVEALAPNSTTPLASGQLSFINNTVDQATGTIQLKGTFQNPESTLWPGQFVNVVLTLSTVPDAVVVPTQAIQTGQQGQYVFVIKPDSTVESRPVVVARTLDSLTVVAKGLSPGERVVADGQLRLYPGAQVSVQPSAAVAAAGGPTP
jgi:multidrug efflux system membrane fusion protein